MSALPDEALVKKLGECLDAPFAVTSFVGARKDDPSEELRTFLAYVKAESPSESPGILKIIGWKLCEDDANYMELTGNDAKSPVSVLVNACTGIKTIMQVFEMTYEDVVATLEVT